jgi:4-hydroxy-tetrahydrodipicolinate synthase
MLSIGAYGVVSVAGHFAGKGITAMIEAYLEGKVEDATQLQYRLLPIFKQVFCTASPIPTKTLFRSIGFDLGDTRLPLDMAEITEAQTQSLAGAFQELGDLGLTLPVPASTVH